MLRAHWSVPWLCMAVFALGSSAAAENARVREIQIDGRTVVIDNTPTRIRIEVEDEFEDLPTQAELAKGLYRSYSDAHQAAERAGRKILPSVSLLLAKCKKFDDGMYAAVELAAEEGMGKLAPGKRDFIARVLGAVNVAEVTSSFGEEAARLAVSRLLGAIENAGWEIDFKSARVDRDLMPDFSRKPVGFYTWSLQLERIYRRDTALQERFVDGTAAATAAGALVARTILQDPELKREYDAINALYARLTNELRGIDADGLENLAGRHGGLDAVINNADAAKALSEEFNDETNPGFALLQPSRSKEMEVVFWDGMGGFTDAVRAGEIDLKPDENSGWYEYQQYSLEPLLLPDETPEGEKLELGEKYRKLLESAFKSVMSQVRETHVKQIETKEACEEMVAVGIAPHLAVEPIATSYLRAAEGYEFLGAQLREHLGPDSLKLHARDEGAVERPAMIEQELYGLRWMLLGAQLLTCRDLGIDPWGAGATAGPCLEHAEEWLSKWHEDPDMARDVRMMIEVARAPNRYWAVVGVQLTKLTVSFVEAPEIKGNVDPAFIDAEYWLPTERFIEVGGLEEPMNREEFRALCDKAKTPDGIVKALKGQGAAAVAPDALGEQTPRPGDKAVFLVLGLIVLALVLLVVWRIARGIVAHGQ